VNFQNESMKKRHANGKGVPISVPSTNKNYQLLKGTGSTYFVVTGKPTYQ